VVLPVKGVPAAEAVIVIAIAGVVVAAVQVVAAQVAVREVTVVATPAAEADAEEGRTAISCQFSVEAEGRSDAALFLWG
jgi:hypothetical protein